MDTLIYIIFQIGIVTIAFVLAEIIIKSFSIIKKQKEINQLDKLIKELERLKNDKT